MNRKCSAMIYNVSALRLAKCARTVNEIKLNDSPNLEQGACHSSMNQSQQVKSLLNQYK